jgi:hypothetical protein
MSEFAWFKTFKSFKRFNPHLCPPPRRGGGIKGGGWSDWNFLNYLNALPFTIPSIKQ